MIRFRTWWSIPFFALTVVVVSNAGFFIVAFPGVAAESNPIAFSRLPVVADAHRPPPLPTFTPTLTARSVYLSATSPWPQTLFVRRADDVFPLASLTKLVSALVVLDADPDWNKEVQIEAGDRRGGARTPLSTSATVTVSDLWTMSLVASDNDATAALARSVVGSEELFVQKMNEKATMLGLERAHFTEPTGLSARNVATARDIAAIARVAFANEKIRSTLAASRAEVKVSGQTVAIFSSDQLVKLHPDGANRWTFLTAKTGYVDESGYNIVLLGKTESGEELLLVLFGSSSLDIRAKEVEQLIAWGAGRGNY